MKSLETSSNPTDLDSGLIVPSLRQVAIKALYGAQFAADRLSGDIIVAGPLLFERSKQEYGVLNMHFRGDRRSLVSLPEHLSDMQSQLSGMRDRYGEFILRGLTHGDLAGPASRVLGVEFKEVGPNDVDHVLRKRTIRKANQAREEDGRPLLPDDTPLYAGEIPMEEFINRDFTPYFPSTYASDIAKDRSVWHDFTARQTAIALGAAIWVTTTVAGWSEAEEISNAKTRDEAYRNSRNRSADYGTKK